MAENQQTDIVINYKGEKFNVTPGFTKEEFLQSLAIRFPELVTATLEKDSEGVYTAKPSIGTKG